MWVNVLSVLLATCVVVFPAGKGARAAGSRSSHRGPARSTITEIKGQPSGTRHAAAGAPPQVDKHTKNNKKNPVQTQRGTGTQKRSAGPRQAKGRLAHPAQRSGSKTLLRRRESPSVQLYNANLHESLQFKPVDERGRPRKADLKALKRLLRCRHTGKQHKLHPRLAQAIYAVGRHFPGHRLEIFSGYRPKKYCDRPRSRHLTGSAIDFRVVGVRNETVIAWLRATFHPAGVGYYPHGVHVHLDVERDHDTYWVDRSGAPPSNQRLVQASPSRTEPRLDPPGPLDPGLDLLGAEPAAEPPSTSSFAMGTEAVALARGVPVIAVEAPLDPPLDDPRFMN